jgi:hypothetical protein
MYNSLSARSNNSTTPRSTTPETTAQHPIKQQSTTAQHPIKKQSTTVQRLSNTVSHPINHNTRSNKVAPDQTIYQMYRLILSIQANNTVPAQTTQHKTRSSKRAPDQSSTAQRPIKAAQRSARSKQHSAAPDQEHSKVPDQPQSDLFGTCQLTQIALNNCIYD